MSQRHESQKKVVSRKFWGFSLKYTFLYFSVFLSFLKKLNIWFASANIINKIMILTASYTI